MIEKQINAYSNEILPKSGNIKHDFNLFYEDKRISSKKMTLKNIIHLCFIAFLTLGLAYDIYDMSGKYQDKIIVPSIEEGVIKMLPMNIEINRNRMT